MISTDGLELEFNVAFVGSAYVKAGLLVARLEEDLVLDHVTVLIGRNPGRAGPQNSLIICLVVAV